MSNVIYATKDECLKAIATLKAIGMEPLPWMLEQLKAFENSEKEVPVVHDSDTPIWDTLQANYPYGDMPQEKKDCVENTVKLLLEEGEHAEEPGLLLGKIQCGKTDTFEDIIGLSFDKGVNIAIVITKGTKALVNQTIMRMKKDYKWFKASDDRSQRSTINIYDIMDIGKAGLKQAIVESGKTVIVCKKQAKNMERLIELFESKSPFLKKKKVIIVDDEADFASRNYQSVKLEAKTDERGNPLSQTSEVAMAKISQQIDDFRKIPEFCRYLQVTATPYCLYLQPQGELNLNGNIVKPFKPRFTSLVPTHEYYIGGQQYFVESANPDSMYSHLYHQLDQKCIDVLGHEDKRYLNSAVSSGNIYGLTYTLVAYFMATAIRRIQVRNEKNRDYKTSAIIHVEIDKKNHDWQKRVVERLIDSIKSAIVDEDHSDQRIWVAMDTIYKDFLISNEKGRNEGLINVELPSQDDILDEIRDIFSPKFRNYHVQMVNSDEEVDKLLDEESGELSLDCAANIFIGGNILDRGVTIKNMLCFFYGRDPKNFQQDTVLQHARMYGARSKEDMAVMRLHTTPHIYKILVRMNELDEQLRQWFIEGKDKLEPNAVFVGYDKNIKPCASTKIKVSNALMLKPQKRILPVGFWTGGKTATKKTIEQIRHLIVSSPCYEHQDQNGFFEMDKDTVVEIIKLIETTFVYDDKFYNKDRKNDIKELLCALEYCTDKSNGKIWALHRENRNMNRLRDNGGYIDAPEDGRTDLRPARTIATDMPVIMFIQQNGDICKDDNGENIGWNGAPFYWPVLLTQANITPVMFALDQKNKGQTAVVDNSDFLNGIDPKDVLTLTYKGDLEDHFGKEGTAYEYEECPCESRVIKQTTAARFIQRDEEGSWSFSPDVKVDEEHYHGVYSLNKGKFPFVLRPYKYICLRNGRDARADMILLELFEQNKWVIEPLDNINKDGDLVDRDTAEVLVHAKDIIIDENLNEKEFIDKTITQWEINYPIQKVLKLRKCIIDWDSVFGKEEE
ncbi:MAG: hypothetical protein J6A02_02155 [Prevotella sp.]|nr:hypothetical protein [Prevotella sp.]